MASEKKQEKKDGLIEIILPVAPLSDGHLPRHIEVGRLTRAQSIALRRLRQGMDETGVRLENKRRIASVADVVRYILEQIPS